MRCMPLVAPQVQALIDALLAAEQACANGCPYPLTAVAIIQRLPLSFNAYPYHLTVALVL
jgi:hypothetical protein